MTQQQGSHDSLEKALLGEATAWMWPAKTYLLCVPMEYTPKICLKIQSQPCSVIPVLFLQAIQNCHV